jgi:transaldolase
VPDIFSTSAKAGVQVATIPFTVIEKMFGHPLIEIELKKIS